MLTPQERKVLEGATNYFIERIKNNRNLVYWWEEPVTPAAINHGQCFNWAWVVYRVFGPRRAKLHTFELCGVHSFPSIDGLYYDSAHMDGVVDWRHVDPDFEGFSPGLLHTQTEDEFKQRWGHRLNNYHDEWDVLIDGLRQLYQMEVA